ncbi:hypothetical protein JCM19241_5958 [Vibrio ishigakensis]|uniref:Uncharacterized protein n=1 Tax=Vibrio ishigakensis TaxID=1481914 RepID=A0A0B8QJ35_9VIBR|nr:hypothetical protein JCM19241_5958 [Vibrio ishigakensis]
MKQVVDSAIDGAESLMEQDMDFAGALGKELYRLSSIADLESKIK